MSNTSDQNTPLNGAGDGHQPPRPNQYARLPFPVLSGTANIEYWFRQLEAWFTLQHITDDQIRFETVVASLTPTLFDQAVDVIQNPPETDAYKKLKITLINCFADSEYTRVSNLLSSVPLGAQRPSHLLSDMRRIGATQDEKLLRVCWLRRLPANIRAVVSVLKTPLNEQAAMADAVYDSLVSEGAVSVSAVTSNSASASNQRHVPQQTYAAPPENDSIQSQLLKRIEELTICVAEIQRGRQSRSFDGESSRQRAPSRGRSKSRTDQRSSTCWYHRNFGTDAKKCEEPCNFLCATQPPAGSK